MYFIFVFVDVICRFSFNLSKKKNDYRVFAGISGDEDKELVKTQLDRVIFANSIASFIGILSTMLPVYFKRYGSMNILILIILYLLILLVGIILSKRN